MITEQEVDSKIIKKVKDLILQEKNSKERLVALDRMIQSLMNRQEQLLKKRRKKFNAKLEDALLKLNYTLAEIYLLKAGILVCGR